MDMRKMGRRTGGIINATRNGRTMAEAAGDPEAVTYEQLYKQRQDGMTPVDINKLISQQMMGTGQMMPAGRAPMEAAADPMMEAIAAWTEVNGREPATDAEFAEIESTLQEAAMGDPREGIVDQMLSGEVEADTSKYRPSPPEPGNTVYETEDEAAGRTGPFGTEQEGPPMSGQSYMKMPATEAIMTITGDDLSPAQAQLIDRLPPQDKQDFYDELLEGGEVLEQLDRWFGGSEEEE